MTAEQWNPAVDLPDLRGKVAVVTGAGTGIGFATVKQLARKGAKVYLTTRNKSKALQAKETLNKEPDVDPENQALLQPPMTAIMTNRPPVHNAAASTASRELVDGKYEPHMAANHMGVFLFTNRLLPLLKNASTSKDADVRIVNVSSTAQISLLPSHFKFNFDSTLCFRDPVTSYPWQWRFLGRFFFAFDMIRYAVSKAAVVLFTQDLQRRFDEQGLAITCIAVHPGEVFTEGLVSVNNFLVGAIARMAFVGAEQGAANSLFAAAATEVRENAEKYKGKFLVPVGKLEAPNPVAEDAAQVKEQEFPVPLFFI
ncbi:uncharacterized protein NECHADRAFT_93865 [Fusarium vanettenii 77-13-4]|uniref:Uncharacterized protein n=1 Tax=Fusarium vanettenii (strain ATCC MYA-4622 / CBS 123669 / FGSC 9596 / NRRL 45880 / 77-13-4) TaxID=660122 RepID=C7YSL6_FUSV7|nr:uncharacterized protein NECHADRAFT_93865 [Fusarium vanettenii 77-13-4]EEU45264.1 hypothetical protein NECHADRAFT_93865 [Fusarium vanettenii 77-13-4]